MVCNKCHSPNAKTGRHWLTKAWLVVCPDCGHVYELPEPPEMTVSEAIRIVRQVSERMVPR
jgi:uncharacterized Zn finger protein